MNVGTPGITVTATGHLIIDKEYRGVRIYVRLGRVSQAEAEERFASNPTCRNGTGTEIKSSPSLCGRRDTLS